MSHIVRELQIVFKEAMQKREPSREFIKAVIVSHAGNIRVPNRPEKVWTSELGRPESLIPAINNTVQDLEGLPVILGWNTNQPHEERVIVSVDTSIPTTVSLGPYSSGPHAGSHEWPTEAAPGPDAVRTFIPAAMWLKTVVDPSSLIVSVNPLTYVSGSKIVTFPGQQIDLTNYMPAAGKVKYVLIYLNKSTNTIKVESGPEVNAGLIPQRPVLPNKYTEPSALIRLTAGQTEISVTDDYIEARNMLGADSALAFGATQVGQIMYSVNGLDLEPRIPLTNDYGLVLVNDQGVIIVK